MNRSTPLSYLEISDALNPKPFEEMEGGISAPIFTEVGRACAQFEKLQDELIRLFAVLCGDPTGELKMTRIIGSTTSFNAKLDLCKEAAATFVNNHRTESAIQSWLKLCRKAAEIRNKIAHGQPMNIHYIPRLSDDPKVIANWA
jgi:hypothetical protein